MSEEEVEKWTREVRNKGEYKLCSKKGQGTSGRRC